MELGPNYIQERGPFTASRRSEIVSTKTENHLLRTIKVALVGSMCLRMGESILEKGDGRWWGDHSQIPEKTFEKGMSFGGKEKGKGGKTRGLILLIDDQKGIGGFLPL